ncbi:pleiotropic regulatory protein RsmS [Tatumella terrea]
MAEQVNVMSLDTAPEEVKLAVDLIMLLEQNQLSPRVVLEALEIVRKDYIAKLKNEQPLSAAD